MLFARGSGVWARRATLVVVLIGAAVIPGRASSVPARHCTGARCHAQAGTIRWARPLPGSWSAQGGALGTVLSQGEAYAAAGDGVAAVGFGLTVTAYGLGGGAPLWTAVLSGFPAGSAIVSVRAWPGVVTAGVSIPAARNGVGRRTEVVLSAGNGRRLGAHPAAAYGGAVAASRASTVIVGTRSVARYSNRSGRVIWRRRTGAVAQAWRVDGDDLFVTVAAGGYLRASPVTALRRIDLRTGAQALLRPAARSFAGNLSGVIGGAVFFAGPHVLTAYSAIDGRQLWQRPGVAPEVVDVIQQTLYMASGRTLVGLDPATGKPVTSAARPGAAGLYAVSGGVALGLDQGALGDAWGYDLARNRVVWTARHVPWPHFFVDLSGIGGSADPSGNTIVLASCARLGTAKTPGAASDCLRPELVAIGP